LTRMPDDGRSFSASEEPIKVATGLRQWSAYLSTYSFQIFIDLPCISKCITSLNWSVISGGRMSTTGTASRTSESANGKPAGLAPARSRNRGARPEHKQGSATSLSTHAAEDHRVRRSGTNMSAETPPQRDVPSSRRRPKPTLSCTLCRRRK
jgi:hypothetical protein